MLHNLIKIRKELADAQRRAGVSLADCIRLQRASGDLFATSAMADAIDSIIDRIEDYTQQLLALDIQIEELKSQMQQLETPCQS